jgi:hypothetical protein
MSSTTSSSSTYGRGVLSGADLVHRLSQMTDGVAKHGNDPGFPNFFAVNDIGAVRDAASMALLKQNAAKAVEKSLAVQVKGEAVDARDLFDRAVLAVESFYGLDSPTLREFGVRPRKGADSAKPNAVRKAKKTRQAHAAQGAVASPTTTTATSPTSPSSSPTGASSSTAPGGSGSNAGGANG